MDGLVFESTDAVPCGWSIKINNNKNKFLKCPDGKVFLGRIQAMKHMLLDSYPLAQVEEMRKSLKHDGWKHKVNLPSGWMVRKRVRKDGRKPEYIFLTENMLVLESIKIAQELVAKSYNENDVGKFQVFLKSLTCQPGSEGESLPIGKSKYRDVLKRNNCLEIEKEGWKEDRRIPMEWRMKKTGESILFMTDARDVVGPQKALEMIKNSGTKEDMEIFEILACLPRSNHIDDHGLREGEFEKIIKQCLLNEDLKSVKENLKIEGWKEDHRLPKAWRMKETVLREKTKTGEEIIVRTKLFLLHTGDVVGASKALELIKESGTGEDIEIFERLAGVGKSEPLKPTEVLIPKSIQNRQGNTAQCKWETSDTLPDGWTVATSEDGKQKILCPDGSKHINRKEALKYMVVKAFPKQEVDTMRSFLREEGWLENEKLPFNWKCKIIKNKRPLLLTPNGIVYDSYASAVRFMEAADEYSQQEIESVKNQGQPQSKPKPIKQLNFNWNSEDLTVPSEWKTADNPAKQYHQVPVPKEKLMELVSTSKDPKKESESNDKKLKMIENPEDESQQNKQGHHDQELDKKEHQKLENEVETEDIEQMIYDLENLINVLPNNAATVNINDFDRDLEATKELILKRSQMKLKETGIKWKENITTIPPGWKITVNDIKKPIMSPKGFTFANRRLALQYIIMNGFPEDTILKMRKYLEVEGWQDDERLPTNWKIKTYKYKNQSRRYIMTESGQRINGIAQVVKFMEASNDYTLDQIENIQKLSLSRQPKATGLVWIENDPTLPPDWKLSSDTTKKNILSPEGTVFINRRLALNHMAKNNYPEKCLEEMRSYLKAEGWETSKDLPEGWKLKSKIKGATYLNPCGRLFQSSRKAVTYLEQFGNCNEDTIAQLKRLNHPMKQNLRSTELKKSNKVTDDKIYNKNLLQNEGWKPNENLPSNWKLKLKPNKPHSKALIMTAQGKIFSGLKRAIKFMNVSQEFSQEDIEMIKTLKYLKRKALKTVQTTESTAWDSNNPTVPTGWKSTHNMTKPGKQTLLSQARPKNKISLKFENIDWDLNDPTVPVGWKTAENSLKPGQQIIMSPNGEQFSSRIQALQHMVEKHSSPEEIEEIRDCLKHEGWTIRADLPDNWRFKKRRHNSKLLTPCGKQFYSLKKAIQHLKTSGKIDEIIRQLKKKDFRTKLLAKFVKLSGLAVKTEKNETNGEQGEMSKMCGVRPVELEEEEFEFVNDNEFEFEDINEQIQGERSSFSIFDNIDDLSVFDSSLIRNVGL